MIEVEKLTKEYRVARHHRGLAGSLRNLVERRHDLVRAVDSISFGIEPGEFVGFIGPNGAGKSTTVKLLTGVLEPSSGRVQVAGWSPRRDRVRYAAEIGVVFGQRTQLWWDLPAIESYELLRRVYRVPAGEYRAQLERLTSLLEIEPLLDVPVRKLSLGQRMRCELAAALLHRPKLLFLDEPTIGLDALAKETIRGFLAAENRAGTTILLTTHDLIDIERLCPRMLLIDRGQLVYDGSVETIRRRFGAERRMQVEFEGPAPAELPPGVEEEERRPERLVLRFRRDSISAGSLVEWLFARAPIADLAVEEPPIERIVAAIYRNGLGAVPGGGGTGSAGPWEPATHRLR
jgi:ABC-2 type transport system ATP-binding protein